MTEQEKPIIIDGKAHYQDFTGGHRSYRVDDIKAILQHDAELLITLITQKKRELEKLHKENERLIKIREIYREI